MAHGDGSISVAELRCDYNPFQASIAAFPTAIRHRRSDQVSPMSKAALTRTLEVTSGKSAYKLVIQGCLRCRTKSRGSLQPRQSLNSPLVAPLRHAEGIEQCPSSRAKPKTYGRTEFFSVCPPDGRSYDLLLFAFCFSMRRCISSRRSFISHSTKYWVPKGPRKGQ